MSGIVNINKPLFQKILKSFIDMRMQEMVYSKNTLIDISTTIQERGIDSEKPITTGIMAFAPIVVNQLMGYILQESVKYRQFIDPIHLFNVTPLQTMLEWLDEALDGSECIIPFYNHEVVIKFSDTTKFSKRRPIVLMNSKGDLDIPERGFSIFVRKAENNEYTKYLRERAIDICSSWLGSATYMDISAEANSLALCFLEQNKDEGYSSCFKRAVKHIIKHDLKDIVIYGCMKHVTFDIMEEKRGGTPICFVIVKFKDFK